MIIDEQGDKCSAKFLANEILIRCLEDISSHRREHPNTHADLTEKERLAVNDQLTKQAIRCFKLLGVHPDDIGQMFDPEDPRSENQAYAPKEIATQGERVQGPTPEEKINNKIGKVGESS